MKRIAAVTGFALFLPLAAHAEENWVYARASDGAMGYETLKVERNEAEGTVNGYLFLYGKKPMTNQGVTYSFQETEADFDCRAPRWRPRETVLYSIDGKQMGVFEPVNDDWLPADENTPWDIVRSAFCEGTGLQDSKTAPSEADAFLGAIEIAE